MTIKHKQCGNRQGLSRLFFVWITQCSTVKRSTKYQTKLYTITYRAIFRGHCPPPPLNRLTPLNEVEKFCVLFLMMKEIMLKWEHFWICTLKMYPLQTFRYATDNVYYVSGTFCSWTIAPLCVYGYYFLLFLYLFVYYSFHCLGYRPFGE